MSTTTPATMLMIPATRPLTVNRPFITFSPSLNHGALLIIQ
jgi:hypothetical protein